MEQHVKRVLSIGSTLVLSLATLIGIPLKSYIHMVDRDPRCVDIGPVKWTPHMAKQYNAMAPMMNALAKVMKKL